MEDSEIVQLFLNRDESAIRFSSEKYGARLRVLALGITEDLQTAEECENDTYLQAWKLIPPNEPRTYLYAFLARITRHLRTVSREKRVIFVRRYFYLESIAEISRKYGFSESKVKSSLFRTRNGLRDYLIREGYTL